MRRRGRRGEGSVTRIKVGRKTRYVARWSRTVDGKRERDSKTFDFEADARWWLRQAKRTGKAPGLDETVEGYLLRWLDNLPDVTDSTRTSYRGHIEDHIVPVIGHLRVADLTPRHVDELRQDRETHVSDKTKRPLTTTTVRRILTTLRMALEAAYRRQELPDNPARFVRLPPNQAKPIEPLTDEAADAIVDATRETWIGLLVRVLLGSGMRLGEALALDQRDVHDGWVSVRVSKTGPRTVGLTADANEAIQAAVKATKVRGLDEPVFISPRTGRRMVGSSVSHALPDILEAAGLPRLAPHGLRHGFGTLATSQGVPLQTVADLLGHRSITMTRRYAHVIPAAQRDALDRVNRAASER